MKITFLTYLGLFLVLNYNTQAVTLAENLQRDTDGDKICDVVEIPSVQITTDTFRQHDSLSEFYFPAPILIH